MDTNKRILIADDLPAIHEDFAKILAPKGSGLGAVEGLARFAPEIAADPGDAPTYDLTFVSQGDEAIRAVTRARAEGRPFALIFLDVRMPPGIDGVETAERLMALDETLQIVLCTAYADYSFNEISRRFRASGNFLILKKPFDPAEVLQVAHALCRKWTLTEENASFIRTLEDKVRERTVALERAHGEVALALKRAQAGESSKRAFLSCISHELYTPLNGIKMGAELIGDSDDPQAAELAKVISTSSDRLQTLFRRVLLYCELDRKAPGSQLQPVEILTLCNKIRTQFEPVATQRRLTWQIEGAPSGPVFLNGDSLALGELLEVLVDNAFKFTEKGGVSLIFDVIEGPALRIIVTDSGPGIRSDLAEILSHPFEPGDSSTTRRHEGFGLGLTLASRLIEHFQGSWSYSHAPGGGSRFTVLLPAAG
ncbi:ATP-binding protein [Nibricoccus sp. IMCC34717]|uniref:ATP-binding response regulator n=1 Tax=Nibricoccus sp. IMCC34717 TaxID=3034021 RepID=UPI00384D1B57